MLILALQEAFLKLFQVVLGEGKMKFNKEEVALLARGDSHHFDKEGALFIREKVEGFFKRNESELLDISQHFIISYYTRISV